MWCDTESHQLFHPLNSTLFPDLPLPCHTHSWHNFSPGENKAGAEPTPANPSWESQSRRDDRPTDGLTTSASSHGREQTHSSMLSRSCQGRPRNEAKQEINSHFLNSPDYFLLSPRQIPKLEITTVLELPFTLTSGWYGSHTPLEPKYQTEQNPLQLWPCCCLPITIRSKAGNWLGS